MKHMLMPFASRLLAISAALVGSFSGPRVWAAETAEITIKVDQSGVKISPKLYGLMTEEINHSYDGGLYAELIQNRAFNDGPRLGEKPEPANPPHWTLVKSGHADGSMTLDSTDPVNTTALPTSLRLDIKASGARVGVANDGYWGIPVKPNTEYRARFYARASADFKGPVTVAIESNDGSKVYASAQVSGTDGKWKKFEATLKTGNVPTSADNRFVISAPGNSSGSLWLSLVSLFPPTFNNRPNGLRADLMELMGGMKPAFLRFPGGNYLEGNTIAERFDWKKTIGPIEERPGHPCCWGYPSTDGLGLMEFLEWCEDLKMEPVLAVYAGYSLTQQRVSAGPDLAPYVQDALDEIEYVTGGPETKWGARRAKDGHPEPFKLTYVEVGNEDAFDQGEGSYEKRFAQFFDAIRAKYPKLQIIATSRVTSRVPDVVDDHYYRSARDMERDAGHYDATDGGHPKFSRTGPKIFVGEWATTQGSPTPTLEAALGDAAWMTGMERNSDVVQISCYAPLLVNVNKGASQWGTNLIGYNAIKSYGSPSYYAQKMFSENRGDCVLPTELKVSAEPVAKAPSMPHGGVGVGTWATQSEYKDMKVTAGDRVLYSAEPGAATDDWKTPSGEWSWDGGVLKQTSDATNCRATVGDPAWTDYTYTLKARKNSGAEGFLILFHVRGPDDYLWWNIGGWNNSRTAIETAEHGAKRELGQASNVKVDANRWYDLKLDVKGRQIRGYVDGQLVTEAIDEELPPPPPMYALAGRHDATGDVILKVVNVEGAPRSARINLHGIQHVAPVAQVEVLTGEPGDVNTVDSPTKVATKKRTIDNAGASFVHEFPAYSVTVLRLKAQ
jgi:alpha-L-arabinofuranosidase